jgi:hypothetical protein
MKKPCNIHKGFVPAIFLCKISNYCEDLEFLGDKFNDFVKKKSIFKNQFLEN